MLPNRRQTNDTLGWVYLKRQQAELAVESFAKSASLAPTDPTFPYHLGLAYSAMYEYVKARAAFE